MVAIPLRLKDGASLRFKVKHATLIADMPNGGKIQKISIFKFLIGKVISPIFHLVFDEVAQVQGRQRRGFG